MSETKPHWPKPIGEIPTRQLLEYLRLARKFGGWYSPVDSHSKFGYSAEELKAELATREHVPNKAEARRLRQDAARKRS